MNKKKMKAGWYSVKRVIPHVTLGMGMGITISCLGADVTWKTWVFWGTAYFSIMLLAFVVGMIYGREGGE